MLDEDTQSGSQSFQSQEITVNSTWLGRVFRDAVSCARRQHEQGKCPRTLSRRPSRERIKKSDPMWVKDHADRRLSVPILQCSMATSLGESANEFLPTF